MNIDKAIKYFEGHRAVFMTMGHVKKDQNYNFAASQWNQIENRALNDFQRKYKVELTLEQRWHIFLTLMSKLPFPIDKSLDDFLQSGINEIATWSVRAKGSYQELNYPESPSSDLLLKGFPFFPLFMYSLNHHEVIYPNNEKAIMIVNHLQELEQLKSRDEIWSWYSRAWGMHKLQSNL